LVPPNQVSDWNCIDCTVTRVDQKKHSGVNVNPNCALRIILTSDQIQIQPNLNQTDGQVLRSLKFPRIKQSKVAQFSSGSAQAQSCSAQSILVLLSPSTAHQHDSTLAQQQQQQQQQHGTLVPKCAVVVFAGEGRGSGDGTGVGDGEKNRKHHGVTTSSKKKKQGATVPTTGFTDPSVLI
jgi:hypothetical protein